MPDTYAQLQRCTNQELLDEVTGFLDLAQIPYRLQSTAGVSSAAWMGFKDQGSVAVMVPGVRLTEARAFLEEQYRNDALPADHYLHSMKAEDLAGMLADPESWSAYDIAHARQLAATRGVAPEVVEELRSEIQEQRQLGKSAPPWILGAALVLACLGSFAGLVSMAMTGSIVFMKETGAGVSYHTYNATSRRWAKVILVLATAVTCYTFGLLLFSAS